MTKDTKKTGENIAYRVLVEPWITEASTILGSANKYVFKVSMRATKVEVKKSIENLYKVGVEAVNTIIIPKKPRTRGRHMGFRSAFKKAIVTVKKGDKIDLFEGK